MKLNYLIVVLLLAGLLIAPVSAAVGDTILFEQVNISSNITQIWNNGTVQIYPVVQGVTSTDNSDQSLDSGWAAANTYALGTTVSESATNIQTFTPTKSKITNISIYATATGTGLTWNLVVHDASNNALSSNSFTPVAGVNSVSVPTLWTSGNLHFHIYASATTGTPTIKSGTTNDLETGSYIEYYAKNTEAVNVTVNGNTSVLDTGDATGLLSGATVDTYKGFYNWTWGNVSDVYAASNGGRSTGDGVIHALNNWYFAGGNEFNSAPDGVPRNITFKINTILPVKEVTFVTSMYSAAAVTQVFQISTDGSTWTTLASVSNGGGRYNNISTTSLLADNTQFYAKFSKPAGASDYAAFALKSINATLNTTTSNATVLTYQTGTNTVNITSYGNAVSSSLDPSLMANVSLIEGAPLVVLPIVQWFTDKTTVVFPGRVKVSDTSLNSPNWWNYTMGDGNVTNISSVDLKNFSYQYTKRGVWPAQLTVSNSVGSNTSAAILIRVIGYAGITAPVKESCWYSVSRDLDILEKARVECQFCGKC